MNNTVATDAENDEMRWLYWPKMNWLPKQAAYLKFGYVPLKYEDEKVDSFPEYQEQLLENFTDLIKQGISLGEIAIDADGRIIPRSYLNWLKSKTPRIDFPRSLSKAVMENARGYSDFDRVNGKKMKTALKVVYALTKSKFGKWFTMMEPGDLTMRVQSACLKEEMALDNKTILELLRDAETERQKVQEKVRKEVMKSRSALAFGGINEGTSKSAD